MTTSRLATLLGVVGLGLLTIFLLPRSAAQPTVARRVAAEGKVAA